MADTTDTAPKRIWDSLTHCAGGQIICYAEKCNDEEIEYIRADLTDAIVQAALERAAIVAKDWWSPTMLQGDEQAQRIRALASDPAEREAIIKAAEENRG